MATTNLLLVSSPNLHVVDADVHAQLTLKAAAAIIAGQTMVIDTAGKFALADADTQTVRGLIYLALSNAAAGAAVTGSKHCVVDGFDLSAHAFGIPLYLSDTAGAISAGTPTGGTAFVIGYLEPISNNAPGVDPDKVVRFCTL